MNIETFVRKYGKDEAIKVVEAAGLKGSYLYSLEKRIRIPRPQTAQALVVASGGRLTLESLILAERQDPRKRRKPTWSAPEVVTPASPDVGVQEASPERAVRVADQLAEAFGREAVGNGE